VIIVTAKPNPMKTGEEDNARPAPEPHQENPPHRKLNPNHKTTLAKKKTLLLLPPLLLLR